MKGYGIPYSHVYIKIWSVKYNRYLIYQASHTMVNFMGTEIFTRENEIVKEFEVELKAEGKAALMQFAIDNAGVPYGVKDALGMAIKRIAEIFGFKIKNPFGDGEQSYVCCELAGYILDRFSKEKFNFEVEEISPKDVYEMLSSVAAQLPRQQGQ